MPENWQIWIINHVMSGLMTAFRIIVIVALAVIGIRFFKAGLHRLLGQLKPRPGVPEAEHRQRIATLQQIIEGSVKVAIYSVAGLMILRELGLNIAPLLAGAGIVGVALGFGAQTLVRDILSGLFILVEDQFNVGEVVRVNGHSGKVERITLRTVWLRDMEGVVHVIPFGSITSVENFSRDWRQVVLDVGIGYGTDLIRAMKIMQEELAALKADARWAESIADDPSILGVDALADSAVILRAILKVKPPERVHDIRREALRRIKLRFDEEGIEIPFPQRTVWLQTPAESISTDAKSRRKKRKARE